MQDNYLCQPTEEIEKQAESIIGEEEPGEQAREIFEWVRDSFVWDMNKIRGASHLLSERPTYAMSFDKSNLLVAMLRSQGFDARFRFMRCKFYNEFKDRVDDSIHAPVEVKAEGSWIVADPAFSKETREFISVSEFGEETWKEVKSEKRINHLPRWFVYFYNYGARFVHPDVRSIREQLHEIHGR